MPRRALSVVAACAAALALTACSGQSGSSSSSGSASAPSKGASSSSSAGASASSGAATAAPSFQVTSDGPAPAVTGQPGTEPAIAKGTGTPSKDLVVKTLSKGSGDAIKSGDLVVTDFVVQKYTDSKPIGSTYQEKTPLSFPIGKGQVMPAMEKLVGTTAGSRVEMVVPPAAGFGSAGNQQAGIKPTDTIVIVFDVRGSYAGDAKATGTPDAKPSADQPQVSSDATNPKITVPKGAKKPSSLQVVRLLKGSGPAVKSGQTLVAQYTGALFDGGKVFDSSWQRGAPAAFVIGKGQVIKGWDEALVGAHVGDRLLLVIPPDKGYGAAGSPPTIPQNATLVFVVDVVGVA